MELFENIIKVNKYKHILRYYCTEEEKTKVRLVNIENENYYITNKKDAEYTSLIGNYKLQKRKDEIGTLYSSYPGIYSFIRDNFWGEKEGKYNKKTRNWSLDIETRAEGSFPDPEEASQAITTIQIYDNVLDKYFIITDKKDSKRLHKRIKKEGLNVEFFCIKDEKLRIKKFVNLIAKYQPYILMAWNGDGFDFPYIYNRMKNIGINPNNLSPYNKAQLKKKNLDFELIIDGIYVVDLMKAYKKFIFDTRPSYALDAIAEIELGVKKVSHTEYLTFDDFYKGNYTTPKKPTERQKNSDIYNVAIKRNEYEKGTSKYEQLDRMVKALSDDEFLWYSIVDVQILSNLDKKLFFTSMMTNIAEKMGVLLNDTLGTVKGWRQYISNIAFLDNKITPFDKPNSNGETNKGGFVRDTIAGRYNWVMSADVNSMYPLLSMVAENMSPETYISPDDLPNDLQSLVKKYFLNENEDERLELDDKIWKQYSKLLEKYNYSGSITGAVFDNNIEGIVPKLVLDIYLGRKKEKQLSFQHEKNALEIKERMEKEGETPELRKAYEREIDLKISYHVKQLVSKVLINALYGAIGNQYFSMYNIEIAKAITGNGRYFIKLLANNINAKLSKLFGKKEYCIAGDTDSVYILLDDVAKEFLKRKPNSNKEEIVNFMDKAFKRIVVPIISGTVEDFSTKLNSKNTSVIGVEREVISESAAFFGKKNYIMAVNDNEGVRYHTPKLKMVGVEIKKSSIPEFVKESLSEAVDIILFKENDDIINFVKEAEDEFYEQLEDSLSKTTSVNKLDYDLNSSKSIPINSRAALVHNKFILDNNLQEQFELIQPGDKIKLIYLNPQNPTLNDIIGYKDARLIDNYFKDYVDLKVVWKKYFLGPLKNMTTPIGWNLEKKELYDEW